MLITAEMVKGMAPGSVIVDLAAERGGNCELTRTGETVQAMASRSSALSTWPAACRITPARCMRATSPRFLLYMVKDGKLQLNLQDEIIRETMVTQRRRNGERARARIFQAAGAGGQ